MYKRIILQISGKELKHISKTLMKTYIKKHNIYSSPFLASVEVSVNSLADITEEIRAIAKRPSMRLAFFESIVQYLFK